MATLSQLLALPELGLRLVQAGPGDPELTWVSTSGLLNIGDYLEGGEVVLTTGLALEGSDPQWFDFVAGLSRARVAALGFGVGVKHDRIPPPLLSAASTFRLALFEVPPPVPFIAVSKAVAALLQADELYAAHRALQVHQRLLDGARGPQDTVKVLASIAQATGRQLALHTAGGEVVASTAGFAAADGADPRATEAVPLDEANSTRLLIAGGAPLGPEGRAVIAAGAMVLGLEVRGSRSDDERERERWARLTESLLGERAQPDALRLLDETAQLPLAVRAVAVLGTAENVSAWRRTPRAGLDRLVTAGEALGSTPGIALAWQLCDDEPEALDRALRLAARHDLDTVVGRPAGQSEAVLSRRSAAGRIGARAQVELLYAAPRTPSVIWADHGSPLLESLLADGGAPPGSLARAVLGPLAASETSEVDRLTLRASLRALLAHNGQRGPAAASLGVHRNTLRDRIARVEALTGRSVDDADDRAELWLALRIEESLGSDLPPA